MGEDALNIIKMKYDNGNYLGEYVKGGDGTPIEHGVGVFVWSNGDMYEGEYVMGTRTGHGVLIWADGKRYEGEFKDDVRSGLGHMTWSDGTVYEGEFKEGVMCGKGKLTWPNGEMYVGWFLNDKMDGHGIHYSSEGDVIYDGDWIESCPIGKANPEEEDGS